LLATAQDCTWLLLLAGHAVVPLVHALVQHEAAPAAPLHAPFVHCMLVAW
jgi:hypothetical protein